MKYYLVKVSNITSFSHPSTADFNTLVLVPPPGPVLLRVEDRGKLVLLHAMHANMSVQMEWDEIHGSSAFRCVHCDMKVNLGARLYQDILQMLSQKTFGPAISSIGTKVHIAHVVEKFLEGDTIPPSGYYVVECDTEDKK